MAFARWQASIVDNRGNVVNAPTIEVRRESDNGLATLYSDVDGLVPLGNPFALSPGEALAFFHVVGGVYKITAAKSGFSRTWRYVPVGTAQAIDTVVDTDGTLAGNSDAAIPSQKAVKTYVDNIVAVQDAMVFKGVIDCSANPNYPAADRGWTYRVSVAGKIGGGSGVNVEIGDLLTCLTDSTSSGTQAAVGAQWTITQANLDGAVIGPSSVTDGHAALFNGITGKLLKSAGYVPGRQYFVDVRDHGALGDGVTDDTAAFQAAAASFGSGGVLATANGGIIYVPPGLYCVSDQTLLAQTGIRIIGAGQESTKILVTANLGSKAVFKFDQTRSDYSQVGCGIENLRINMDGNTGHGVWMLKPYDGVTVTNVYVDNVADAYNGFRIEEDSGVSDIVSQTICMTNCAAIHENATADEPLFYFDSVQEAALIGCKAFGTYESNGKATCYPFEFEDCRGIAMVQCSAAFADRHGIHIFANDRPTSGILIDNCTFETIDGAVFAAGNVNGDVINLKIVNPRTEGTVAHSNGAIDLNKVVRSHIESMSLTVNLNSDCARCSVTSEDDSQVTDAGTQTTIIGWANGIHSTLQLNVGLRAPSVNVNNTGLKALDTNGTHYQIFKPGSNITADRTLEIITGDADRTLDMLSATTNPVVTAASGTLTTVSCTMRTWRFGTLVFFQAVITITDAGTGSGGLRLPLPFTAASAGVIHGREVAATGFSLNGSFSASGTTVDIFKYDFTTIIATGRTVSVAGFMHV